MCVGPVLMGKIALAKKRHRMKHTVTRGEMESAIRNASIKFEQEFMGRPTDVRVSILRKPSSFGS